MVREQKDQMDLSKKTTYQLKAMARRENIPLPAPGTGSGRGGRVLKRDIIAAIGTHTSGDLSKLSKTQLKALAEREDLIILPSDRKLDIIEAILASRITKAVRRKKLHQPQPPDVERIAIRLPAKKRPHKKKKQRSTASSAAAVVAKPLKKRPLQPPKKRPLLLKKRPQVKKGALPGTIDFTKEISTGTYLFRNSIKNQLESLMIVDRNLAQSEQFRRWIDTWKRLSRQPNCHPAVPCIYSDGLVPVHGEVKYAIRFEYRKGSADLATFIRREGRHKIPLSFMLPFVWKALKGLKYLHDKDVIHGSIHPRNILLAPNTLQYMNFGHGLFFWPNFSAPEVFRNLRRIQAQTVQLSTKQLMANDIYALGAIFYFINRQQPYTPHAMATNADPKPFVYKQMPELEDFISGMVAKDPDERTRAFETLLIFVNLHAALQQKPNQQKTKLDEEAPGTPKKQKHKEKVKRKQKVKRKPVITYANWDSKPCKGKGSWTLQELQDYARWHDLTISGSKRQLCKRVRTHIASKVPFESLFTSERVPDEILVQTLLSVAPEDLIKMCEMTPRLHEICQDPWFRNKYSGKWDGHHPPLVPIVIKKVRSGADWTDLFELRTSERELFDTLRLFLDEPKVFAYLERKDVQKHGLGIKKPFQIDMDKRWVYSVYYAIIRRGKDAESKKVVPGHYIVIRARTTRGYYTGYLAVGIKVHANIDLNQFTRESNILSLLQQAIHEKRIGFVVINLQYLTYRHRAF
jgi:serine/threonine protein kinase